MTTNRLLRQMSDRQLHQELGEAFAEFQTVTHVGVLGLACARLERALAEEKRRIDGGRASCACETCSELTDAAGTWWGEDPFPSDYVVLVTEPIDPSRP